MKDGPSIVRIAALVGDHARAEILTALVAGQALTATELAQVAGVTKQTVSAHLAKLLDARLLAAESQGRHRYFRLADRDVAALLENLMGVAYRAGAMRVRPGPREPELRKARVCYDHLAGERGVWMYERLRDRQLLSSHEFFERFGIDVDALAKSRRPFSRTCLDWSERRHHLGGALGAAILDRIFALRWAQRELVGRAVIFSANGERELRALFG